MTLLGSSCSVKQFLHGRPLSRPLPFLGPEVAVVGVSEDFKNTRFTLLEKLFFECFGICP